MKERTVQLVPDLKWKGGFNVGGEHSINSLHLQKKNYKFGVAPMFEITDPDTETVAEYFDGKPAAAVKKNGAGRVWYFALPLLAPEQINALLKECGCHIYRKPGSATLCGGGIIELTSSEPETGTLKLKNGKEISYTLKKAETAIFDANTGEKFAFTY